MLVSDALNHKFLRSGFISDSAILCQTHGSFSINVEWICEQITSTPSVAHCIFPSLIFSACPVLYSYGILSRIHLKFFEENSSRNSGRMRVVSESLRKGEELSECALDSLLVGQLGRTFLPHSPRGLCAPAIIFDDCSRSHCSCVKMPPNGILSYWVLKLHLFFRKNNFGEPHTLSIWEGELGPSRKEAGGFIPFFCILFYKIPKRFCLNDNTWILETKSKNSWLYNT